MSSARDPGPSYMPLYFADFTSLLVPASYLSMIAIRKSSMKIIIARALMKKKKKRRWRKKETAERLASNVVSWSARERKLRNIL
jgi:hypothetical protein